MSKEHRSQLEGAPTGKIWDNLSFYMCDELWHIEFFKVHGDIQKDGETPFLQKKML